MIDETSNELGVGEEKSVVYHGNLGWLQLTLKEVETTVLPTKDNTISHPL